MSKSSCEYCGVNWGLRTESIENVEQLFDQFANYNKINKKQFYYQKNWYFMIFCFIIIIFLNN